jgi:hypothetical protein
MRQPQKQPRTLEEAVETVTKLLVEWDQIDRVRRMVRQCGVDDAISLVHHGIGQDIRNDLHLWEPKSLALRRDIWEKIGDERRSPYIAHWSRWSPDRPCLIEGEMHADDASSEILRDVFTRLM